MKTAKAPGMEYRIVLPHGRLRDGSAAYPAQTGQPTASSRHHRGDPDALGLEHFTPFVKGRGNKATNQTKK
ncbi:MAG: hypothetical protein WA849_12765 [Candidatus Udaeobacter sp.]